MTTPLPQTRAALRAVGVGNARLRTLLRRGDLVAVGHDRFVQRGATPVPVELLAAAGGSVALSHTTAARAWGLPADGGGPVHVCVPERTRRRTLPAEVTVHRARGWEATFVAGVPVTSLARTLADVAGSEPLETAIPVLDAGLRLLTAREVEESMTPRSPQLRRVRRALTLADPRAESPLESRLRLLLHLGGLPPQDVQHVVRDGGRFVARVDLWFEGLVVEADGFAFHSAREDYRRDRRRQQAFARLGLRYLPFSWEDVHYRPDQVVSDVRRSLAAIAAA